MSKTPLRVRPSHTHVLANDPTSVWAELRVKAPSLSSSERDRVAVASDVVLVLDCSGSMGSGANSPLDFAGQAAAYVLRQLGPDDRCAVIGYGSQARVIHPLSSDHQKGITRVRALPSMGTTAMADGLQQAAALLSDSTSERPRRIFLLSDGHANVGVSDPAGLADLAASLRAQHGITFSTFGVGAGFNESLMERIATAGAGGYHFVEDSDQIPAAFSAELRGLLSVTLSDVTVRYTTTGRVTAGEVLGPDADDGVISLGDLPAGAVRRALVCLSLPGLSRDRHVLTVALTAQTLEGEEITASEDLTIRVTDDANVVADGVDEKVMARVIDLQSAAAEAEAAGLADAGDIDGAREAMQHSLAGLQAYAAAVPSAAPMLAARQSSVQASIDDLVDYSALTSKRIKHRSYLARSSRG